MLTLSSSHCDDPLPTCSCLEKLTITIGRNRMTNQGDEDMFRALAIATVLAAALLLPQGSAHAQGKWCAVYSGGGGTNCGITYKQCRADVSGVGGYCRRYRRR